MDNKLYFGVCYYPEQWDRDRWAIDIELMHKAGINIVRLMDLSWSVIEPRDNEFDFSIFDSVLDIMQQYDMKAIVCTPTMVPPMWMWKKHPDIFASYPDTIEHINEIRSRACFNNHTFKAYSKRITEQMALHFKDNPTVVAWQIDNEINANKCCCPNCASGFRKWLQQKYGTLDNLNKAWGNVFWSMIYSDWNEVAPPVKNTELTFSVSQILDYKRFTSQSAVNFLKEQSDIIHSICPNHKVTHNGMTLFMNLNYYELGKYLDFYGVDIYPAVDYDYIRYSLAGDFSRGVKRDNYFVMEQKNGYFNYAPYNLAIPPKWVTMWTVKDIAHGANGVVYFRWRSGCYGSEQHPQGLLRHDATPRRVYNEVMALTDKLSNYSNEIAQSKVITKVAMLWSFDSAWSLNTHVQNSKFDYIGHFMQYYSAFLKNGITVDVIDENQNLDGYKIVVALSLFIGKENVAKNLEKFAENGGTVILTVRTGIRTDANTTTTEPWPGHFANIAGIRVDEFDSLPDYMSNSITYKGKSYSVGCFLDIVSVNTAKPIATYNEKFYQNVPACTKNSIGKGYVYYSCVMNSPDFFFDFIGDVCRENEILTVTCPNNIEIVQRCNENCIYTFIINNAEKHHTLYLKTPAFEILNNTQISNSVEIKEFDTLIFKTDKPLSFSFI